MFNVCFLQMSVCVCVWEGGSVSCLSGWWWIDKESGRARARERAQQMHAEQQAEGRVVDQTVRADNGGMRKWCLVIQ